MSIKDINLKSTPRRTSETPALPSVGQTKSGILKPTLSLCMIVKNEEKFLPTCLESAKDYVDEIIIVDTGSTDKTVEIAERYNAKVYHHPWENSFQQGKKLLTESMQHAIGF